MSFKSIVPTLLLALAAPALAQQPAAPSAQPATEAATPPVKSDPNAIRCRRVDVTGSLVKKYKVCKTNAEWNRLTDGGNRVARQIVETGGVCAGGGCGGQ